MQHDFHDKEAYDNKCTRLQVPSEKELQQSATLKSREYETQK